MSLAMPTPDFEPSGLHLAQHLATFLRAQQIAPEPVTLSGGEHPGEDETDGASSHPKLALRQLSVVFGERR